MVLGVRMPFASGGGGGVGRRNSGRAGTAAFPSGGTAAVGRFDTACGGTALPCDPPAQADSKTASVRPSPTFCISRRLAVKVDYFCTIAALSTKFALGLFTVTV